MAISSERAPKTRRVDAELEEFRNLMTPPDTFEEGFSWKALLGALFISLLMVPGAIYMGLLAGAGMGSAAQWVTVILFIEIARRAQQTLKRAEIFILFTMAGMAMGAPFSGLLWNQFYVRSKAASEFGIAPLLPHWFAPSPELSETYATHNFLHADWMPVIGLVIFGTIFGTLANWVLGYGLFRVVSDIEKLPFPMAPVGAQGIMALAEDADESKGSEAQSSWRWRMFAIGGAIGLAFGAIYLLLPSVTAALTGTSIQILPIPFLDTTAKTQQFLPAVATGISWDIGSLFIGMVLPFYSVIGTVIGIVGMMIANPIMYKANILQGWQSGYSTIPTVFNNNIDFYMSFGIGLALAVFVAGIWQCVKALRERKADIDRDRLAAMTVETKPKTDRGDIHMGWVIATYFVITVTYICVSMYLIGWERKNLGVLLVLVFLGFVYTPLISYITARLEGMAGQVLEIPMVREASFILSGYRGVAIWFLPVPMANYGAVTVAYRQSELVGSKFSSLWKTIAILTPIVLISSLLFMNFIWGLGDVPSAVYPFANMMWDLQAQNSSIMFTSTLGDYGQFNEAFKPGILGIGAVFGVGMFALLSVFGAPTLLFYGLVRGLGYGMPHFMILEFIGAMIGRFYFQRKMGEKWRQYIPVIVAGFSCGMGLVTVLGVGITFLSKAVVQLSF